MKIVENFEANQMLARFQLIENVGCGKSGRIWSALDTKDNSIVALKIYSSHTMEAKARYEFDVASRMKHPNILQPTEFLLSDELPVMVMPYCLQRSAAGVAGYVDECRMWQMVRDVASALSYIHQQGWVHRDVKPSNILLSDDGKALLSDFGSSCQCGAVLQSQFVSNDGSSFRFDAPECRDGYCCTMSDIWSLGATVFYLYMGCHLFNGLGGRAQGRNTKVPMMRRDLPELSGLIKDCLHYDPTQRPKAEDILIIADSKSDACRRDATQRPQRKVDVAAASTCKVQDRLEQLWPEEMEESI